MKYHIIAFAAGFLLDQLLGDPYFLPHPIRGIGWLITQLEKWLRGNSMSEPAKMESKEADPMTQRTQGRILVLLVLLITGSIAAFILVGAYHIYSGLGVVIESIMTYQTLAARCLQVESGKVWKQLKAGDLQAARTAVSMIVGRDTENLTEEGVAKAAIETVAENTSDGVIAPMLYTAFGGPVLGFLYKAINTMDSMVGYKNEKYLYFGRAAAKLDDVVNYLPSRISALLMIGAAFLSGGEYHGRQAWQIWRRDSRKHASPNSAQTESVCAGALGIQLAGDASYFGKVVKKPYIGDPVRPVEYEDIRRANHGRQAWQIWRRDSRKHASPNSAQTESVCAGALGIQLAGDASYFGKVVKKPYIGDPVRPVEYEDIRRANHLMNRTAWICEVLCLGILAMAAFIYCY